MSRPSRPAAADGPVLPAEREAAFAHRNLPLLLLLARETVISRFRPLLKAHGLTEQQWRILRALVDIGPMEPRQIVRCCGISSPSLTGVLARMDELGLVVRERFDHDARRVRVTLTPKSREFVQQLAPRIERLYAELERAMGRDFLQELYGALDVVIAAGRSGDAAAEPGVDTEE
jgi:homoprotocatechuate degradation regulator HpaR